MSESSNDPMASYTFDTLSYAKELIAAGMPQQQAEVISLRQRSLIENELATKTDIKNMEIELKRDIKVMEFTMTIRLGTIVVISLGAITALNQLIT